MLHYALPQLHVVRRPIVLQRYGATAFSGFTPDPRATNSHALVIEKLLLCISEFQFVRDFQEELIDFAKATHTKVAEFSIEINMIPLQGVSPPGVGSAEWPTMIDRSSPRFFENIVGSRKKISIYWVWYTLLLDLYELDKEVVLQQLLPDLDRRWCEALLRKLDQDGNGVTTVELQPFIESLLNRGMSSVELNIDSNADSQIDVEELYEWQKRANEPKRTSSSTLGGVGSSPSPDGASRPGVVPASPSSNSVDASDVGVAAPEGASDELLYEGKNLTTWLDLLQRERQDKLFKSRSTRCLAEYREGLAEDPPIDLGNIAEMDGSR